MPGGMRPMMGQQQAIISGQGMVRMNQMGSMRQGQPNMMPGQPRMINAPGVRMQTMVSKLLLFCVVLFLNIYIYEMLFKRCVTLRISAHPSKSCRIARKPLALCRRWMTLE